MGINDAQLECDADGEHVEKFAAWEAIDECHDSWKLLVLALVTVLDVFVENLERVLIN